MKFQTISLFTFLVILGCQDNIQENVSESKNAPIQSTTSNQKNSCEEYFYLTKLDYGIPNAKGEVLIHKDNDDSLFISSGLVCSLHVIPKWEKRFPNEIYNFKNLEYLWLAMRDLETLPDELIQLQKLKHLDFQHSSLKELPENIGALKNLEELVLLGTDIEELPLSICELSNLKRLHLGISKIKTFPKCIDRLTSLKKVIAFHENGEIPISLLKEIQELQKKMPNCYFSY